MQPQKENQWCIGKWGPRPGNRVAITPGAVALLEKHPTISAQKLLARFFEGDWGTVCDEDWQGNNDSVKSGGQLIGSYEAGPGNKVWVVQDPGHNEEHRVTTLLLPDEY